MTKYAVLIGINYTGTSAQLAGCVNDVLNMKKHIAGCGYHESNITTMTDNSRLTRDTRLVPTRANIWEQLDNAVAKLRAGDTLFVQYSGHGTGILDRDTTLDEKDRQDECWCPLDSLDDESKFIVDDELKERLANRVPVGARLRVISDSCKSGTFLDAPRVYARGKRLTQDSLPFKQSDDIMGLSGCMDNQYSNDAYIAGIGQGALTWALLDTLKTCEGWTAREIVTAVRLKLREKGYDQFPILSMGNKKMLDRKFEL